MDLFDLRQWPYFSRIALGKEHSPFIDQISIDSQRIDSQRALFIALKGRHSDGHKFIRHAALAGARYAIVDKEWSDRSCLPDLLYIPVENTLRAFQEITRCYRQQLKAQMIAIAGSYGKTMVKDLLLAMLSQKKRAAASPESFNSQIGVPLSLLNINREHELALIEAGISKRGEMDILAEMILPDCAIITHIGKKHLISLGSIQTTAEETMKIALKVKSHHWILLPDDPLLYPYLDKLSTPYFFWDKADYALPHAYSLAAAGNISQMNYVIDFPDGNQYRGHTNFGFNYFLDLINITVKAAWKLGLSASDISGTLKNYTPEPMRTEIWKSSIGSTFINDTYCSDPQSIDLALRHFDQASKESRKIFVFGGMRGTNHHSGTDFKRVGKALKKSGLSHLFLVGNNKFEPLVQEVASQPSHPLIFHCKTYEEAFSLLKPTLKNEDVILIKGTHKQPLDELTKTFNDSVTTNQCQINLAAIQANIETIRNNLPENTRVMVMVKALAYGTDDIRIAKFLANCHVDILGVSYVDEGIALKRAGVSQDIFVINAAIYEVCKVVKWDLEVAVSEKDLIVNLAQEAARQNKRIKVHLHVDTGMNRFGCRPEESLDMAKFILQHSHLSLVGIMTHFACADDPNEDEFTKNQAHVLQTNIEELFDHGITIPWKHAANSAGAIRFKFPQFNMVRIGLAVYGLHASHSTRKAIDLRLAVSLLSRIVGINNCKAGETISYGRSYTVERETQKFAVIPVGYFDGLHRNYSGKGQVIIRGHKAPMVGKICMDYMMVDITDIPHAGIGDSVLIFGEDEYGNYLAPEELALQGASIVHELITCLGPRIQRIFVHEEIFKQTN